MSVGNKSRWENLSLEFRGEIIKFPHLTALFGWIVPPAMPADGAGCPGILSPAVWSGWLKLGPRAREIVQWVRHLPFKQPIQV